MSWPLVVGALSIGVGEAIGSAGLGGDGLAQPDTMNRPQTQALRMRIISSGDRASAGLAAADRRMSDRAQSPRRFAEASS